MKIIHILNTFLDAVLQPLQCCMIMKTITGYVKSGKQTWIKFNPFMLYTMNNRK